MQAIYLGMMERRPAYLVGTFVKTTPHAAYFHNNGKMFENCEKLFKLNFSAFNENPFN